MRVRLPHRTATRVAAGLLVAATFTSCGNDEGDTTETDASSSQTHLTLAAPVSFEADPDAQPSPGRVAEILDTLTSADISEGSVEYLEGCPLGTSGTLFSALPPDWEPPAADLSGSIGASSSFDHGPAGKCGSDAHLLFFEPVDSSLSEEERLAGAPDREWSSEPVDFFGGRAYTYCFGADATPPCGAAWFNDVLQVGGTLDLKDQRSTPEVAAAWLSAALPIMLGDEASAAPFNIAGHLPLIDTEGYTLDASYDFTASDFAADPVNSPPGYTELVQPVQGSLTVTNTTPGRSVEVGMSLVVQPLAAYARKSQVCRSLGEIEPKGFVLAGDYCLVSIGVPISWGYALVEDQTLDPDAVVTLTSDDLSAMADDPGQTRLAGVSEGDADALAGELAKPAGIVLYGGTPNGGFVSEPAKWHTSGECTLTVHDPGGADEWIIYPTDRAPAGIC
ncbi:hypothetical protein FB382_000064 [Nocardioides ginsengisegetis]|uniref:Uncharacterized protein n=1 Tax=Nocardioides ginsengisegetis TaxID=661491 RepID=A0A7W3IWA7_9ACTN|nr:hypothetical protein [Nocardioides ginsengisegetis]MBA8801773.1 hypothetical protein [Nocardioides ginsengisegetis]